MSEIENIKEELEVAKGAIRILLQHLREHEAKLNILADNVVILKDQKLQILNSPN
jgi:hypothetical protein